MNYSKIDKLGQGPVPERVEPLEEKPGKKDKEKKRHFSHAAPVVKRPKLESTSSANYKDLNKFMGNYSKKMALPNEAKTDFDFTSFK